MTNIEVVGCENNISGYCQKDGESCKLPKLGLCHIAIVAHQNGKLHITPAAYEEYIRRSVNV